ncbi:leucine-rich repeat-containing protein 74A-like [Mytilus edulis]|uniref:leucine-rich repeat-containing protein 74A-like n=1 Tax=Mytilus edulis TaxID=6550 RepID=UPI0039EF9FA3
MTELSEDNLLNHLATQHGHFEKKRTTSFKSDKDSEERRTPTQRGSAKLKRISSSAKSAHSLSSIEDKFSALSTLIQDRLLITEFPGRNSAAGRINDDDAFEEEFPDETPPSGRVTKEGDYDTDLEMDYDDWLHAEKILIEEDKTGERKYIDICNKTGVIPVSYFVRHIQNKEFEMKYHGLGPLGAKAIALPLRSNRKIEKVNIEGNWIESQGAIYLAQMLANNIYLTELHLAENKIGNDGAKAISEMLLKNDMIHTVDLSGNDIDDNGAEVICSTLMKNTTIKHVYLSKNSFEERAAISFKHVLLHNESLDTIDLSWNHIRTRGASAIAEGLQENFGLKTINLAMNGFSLMGSEAIGKAIKQNRTLRSLDISHNRIPQDGAKYIAKGLSENDGLQELKIGSNPLGSEGPLNILQAIEKNDICTVTELDLSNVLVTEEFQELQDKLEKDRILTVTHGGIAGELYNIQSITFDPLHDFRKNPVGMLRDIAKEAGYRMIDLFKDFDKDGNSYISKDEFVMGIKRAGMQVSVRQIEVIMEKLDTNKDGCVDYAELIAAERELRRNKLEQNNPKLDRKNSQLV